MASDKEKQLRMTLEDCLYNQGRLRDKLKFLISENRPLTYPERQDFYDILPKALISQGAKEPVYFVYDRGWFIFESVQALAHRLADLDGVKIKLTTTRPEKCEVNILISELWRFLYEKIIFLFPQATAEAVHISAESVERPQQQAYSFSSKEGFNDRE
jgi:hypothetical protein